MAKTKEILNKIKSILSTQKITRAMEMVSASKMKKAQDRMKDSRHYSEKMKFVIEHIISGKLEYNHPYLVNRTGDKYGYIVVSSDRGLCGGLNVNLFRSILNSITSFKSSNIKVSTIGKKSFNFFSKIGCEILASKIDIPDKVSQQDVLGVVKVMLDSYNNNSIDKLFLVYNEFVNTIIQKPTIYQLLPIVPPLCENKKHWDYIYEPEAKFLIDNVFNRYVESLVYQSVIENISCEQAARMVAMKNASDNAGDIVGECKLAYNKARQASITQELSEIVAGAAAV